MSGTESEHTGSAGAMADDDTFNAFPLDQANQVERSACDQSDPPPFAVHVTATTPSSPGPLAGLPTSPHTHVYKEPVEYIG